MVRRDAMENGVVNTTEISGRVNVVEVENSYRGMMSVIGRMDPKLRYIVCGAWDAPEDDGLLALDEYCTWCGVFRSPVFKPSAMFLEVDGEVCMRVRSSSMTFVYYMSYDRSGSVNIFDYRDMSTYEGLSNQEISDTIYFMTGWSSRRCGPSILMREDAEWLFGEASAEERARVARTLPCSDGHSRHQVDYEDVVGRLARDESPLVRAALAVNGHMYDPWITMGLHTDRDWRVRMAVASECRRNGMLTNLPDARIMRRHLLDDREPEVRLRLAAEIINSICTHCWAENSERLAGSLMKSCDERIREYAAMRIMESR